MVKSVVKTFCRCFFEKGNSRKSECLQGFSAFWKTHGRKVPARSQTRRATNCATSRFVIVVRLLSFFGSQTIWQSKYFNIIAEKSKKVNTVWQFFLHFSDFSWLSLLFSKMFYFVSFLCLYAVLLFIWFVGFNELILMLPQFLRGATDISWLLS